MNPLQTFHERFSKGHGGVGGELSDPGGMQHEGVAFRAYKNGRHNLSSVALFSLLYQAPENPN